MTICDWIFWVAIAVCLLACASGARDWFRYRRLADAIRSNEALVETLAARPDFVGVLIRRISGPDADGKYDWYLRAVNCNGYTVLSDLHSKMIAPPTPPESLPSHTLRLAGKPTPNGTRPKRKRRVKRS